jgi:hypothetical protein
MQVTIHSEVQIQRLATGLATHRRTIAILRSVALQAALIGVVCVFWGLVVFAALGSIQ